MRGLKCIFFKFSLNHFFLLSFFILFFILGVSTLCLMNDYGLFGYRLVKASSQEHHYTQCNDEDAKNLINFRDKFEPLQLLSVIASSENRPPASNEEQKIRDRWQAFAARHGNSRLSTGKFFVCVFGEAQSRVALLVKTPLRSQYLLGVEYRQPSGNWQFLSVAIPSAYFIFENPISAFEIARSFQSSNFRLLTYRTWATPRGQYLTGNSGLNELHKAHFVFYLRQTHDQTLSRLPILRAFWGPALSVEERLFDSHVEDVALYNILYWIYNLIAPCVIIICIGGIVVSIAGLSCRDKNRALS
tara:strand:- start:166 stop:1071 length:906 start_codon:yes stop_codon:yes gene_type:complete